MRPPNREVPCAAGVYTLNKPRQRVNVDLTTFRTTSTIIRMYGPGSMNLSQLFSPPPGVRRAPPLHPPPESPRNKLETGTTNSPRKEREQTSATNACNQTYRGIRVKRSTAAASHQWHAQRKSKPCRSALSGFVGLVCRRSVSAARYR